MFHRAMFTHQQVVKFGLDAERFGVRLVDGEARPGHQYILPAVGKSGDAHFQGM